MSTAISHNNPVISSPDTASDFFHSVMDKIHDQEAMVVAFLNTRNRVIDYEEVSLGTINSSIIHPREVFRNAILNKANSVILCHNHPSGDTTPSNDDRQTTKRLQETGEILGIPVIDHVIINGLNRNQVYSFRANGVLEESAHYRTELAVSEQMAPYKNAKDSMKEITDKLETGIRDFFDSEKYQDYLRTMSRFHHYSLNNTLLIAMQKPDATLVAGFNKWQDQFGRNVIKGEKGIKIIAPTPYKVKKEMEKLDPLTKAPLTDQNGKVLTEEVEVKIPLYRVVSVFDLSQTAGKPLPQLASSLTGDVRQYEIFMDSLRRSSPVPIMFEVMKLDMDGYFSPGKQRIAIREGMSEVQTVSAAIHEIAHAKLHNRNQLQMAATQDLGTSEQTKPKDRRTEEVEAESISFAVCAHYGIQTGENSFGYIAAWSKDKDLPELRASLETIGKTSSELIDDVDRNFAILAKERGINLATAQPDSEHAAAEPLTRVQEPANKNTDPERFVILDTPEPSVPDGYPVPDPAISIAAMNAYGYTDDNMLPLTLDRAVELYEKDMTVYMLYGGNAASMAVDRKDIDAHAGIFAISRSEWEKSPKYQDYAEARQSALEQLMQAFRNNPGDAFAIYQLKSGDEFRDYLFEPMKQLQAANLAVEHSHYDLIYTGLLNASGNLDHTLNSLYKQFNLEHPADFTGHSLSVSDVIVLKQTGQLSAHYVDNWSFQPLQDFLAQSRHLRSVEDTVEQNDNHFDGLINNLPAAAEQELKVRTRYPVLITDLGCAKSSDSSEKRPSLKEQLKNPAVRQVDRKAALAKSVEMEL
jgi:antirestriction protein ArdC/proteasome lid subunit RPN8/RPN11